MLTKTNKTDSKINCQTRVFLNDPRTFLTPTSLDLVDDFAVDKFIKLMEDNNNIRIPIEPKISMNAGFPVGPKILKPGYPLA